jgi:hypothetical protein
MDAWDYIRNHKFKRGKKSDPPFLHFDINRELDLKVLEKMTEKS